VAASGKLLRGSGARIRRAAGRAGCLVTTSAAMRRSAAPARTWPYSGGEALPEALARPRAEPAASIGKFAGHSRPSSRCRTAARPAAPTAWSLPCAAPAQPSARRHFRRGPRAGRAGYANWWSAASTSAGSAATWALPAAGASDAVEAVLAAAPRARVRLSSLSAPRFPAAPRLMGASRGSARTCTCRSRAATTGSSPPCRAYTAAEFWPPSSAPARGSTGRP